MPAVIEPVLAALVQVAQVAPIGTNLGLLHLLWMLVSGALLISRGALFPALQWIGLEPAAIRRAWAALAYGAWRIDELLQVWEAQVRAQGDWQEHCHEGYRPLAVDLTGFWRPQLQNCPGKHYHPQAGKALPAITLGMVTRVGSVGEKRVPLPCAFVRAPQDDPSESALEQALLEQVAQDLAPDEMPVLDAGFLVSQIQQAQLPRYVVRLALNFTAHRNRPAPYKGRGPHPIYGEKVRPLPRKRLDKVIAATPADEEVSWVHQGRILRAQIWKDLVLPGVLPGPEADSFHVVAIFDPRYRDPLLLACPVELTPQALRALYRDRWPVEQIPLAAKQMLGAHRQFVSAPESCQRLPELALLAGAMMTCLAAGLSAIPTGFWDRQPRATAGRLRRALFGQPFPQLASIPGQLRVKASVTDHLPKGIEGHRRTAAPPSPPPAA